MKAVGEVLLGVLIGLGLGGLMIWGLMRLGDYIVRTYP